uniref:Uncharacterized protein n=1 Tax=Quercus lobata TaxID=97700 RepID=A0A7N2R4J6_QUELO
MAHGKLADLPTIVVLIYGHACKMLADQFIGGSIIDTDSQSGQELVSKTPRKFFHRPTWLSTVNKRCLFDLG